MMESMKLQENIINHQAFANEPTNNFFFNQSPSLFSNNSNQNMNSGQVLNMKGIDTKKQIQSECSVYGESKNYI